MKNLLQLFDEPIVIIDKEFNIKNFNDSFLRITSYNTKEDLNGKNFLEFLPIEKEHKLVKTKLFQKTELKNITIKYRNAEYRFYDIKWSVFDDKDTYIFILKNQQYNKAVSEIKDINKYYDIIIEKSNVMLLEIDKSGKILSINNIFAKIMGYSAAEILGENIETIFFRNNEIKEFFNEYFKEILKDNYCPEFELPVYTKSGNELYLLWNVNKLEHHGELKSILFICQNISMQKKLEKKLIDYTIRLENIIQERTQSIVLANKELIEANKAKDEFLQNISHELRTPLTPIVGYTELLMAKKNVEDDFRQKIYDKIKRNTEKLISIINDLVDLSKLEAGKIDVFFVYTDINPIILSALETVKSVAVEKNISINLSLSKEKLNSLIDTRLMEQVFWNLFANAIKFTNQNGSIFIKSYKKNNEIVIEVKDTGIGIKKENLNKIFQRFYQADGSLTRKFGGLGIGLALVKKYVELHNGKVFAESEGINKGSVFYIKLPIKNKDELDIIIKKKIVKSRTIKRLLIIDDELTIIELFQILLSKNLFEIHSATSLETAVKLLNEKKFDIIFLDLNLPNISGVKSIDVIKEYIKNKNTKIIALTAFALKNDMEILRSEGFDFYLTKPFNIDDLLKVIDMADNATKEMKQFK